MAAQVARRTGTPIYDAWTVEFALSRLAQSRARIRPGESVIGEDVVNLAHIHNNFAGHYHRYRDCAGIDTNTGQDSVPFYGTDGLWIKDPDGGDPKTWGPVGFQFEPGVWILPDTPVYAGIINVMFNAFRNSRSHYHTYLDHKGDVDGTAPPPA